MPSDWAISRAPSTRPASDWRGKRRAIRRSWLERWGRWAPISSRFTPLLSPRRARSSASRRRRWWRRKWTPLVLETFYNLDELREAIFAACARFSGLEMVIVAQVTIDDYGNPPGEGSDTETIHQRSSNRGLRGCDRGQLLRRVRRSCSADHREDDAVFEEAHERDAQRRASAARGGPPHLSVLTGVHVAVRAALSVGGRKDDAGGRCGTTPEHIKLVKFEARSLQPGQAHLPSPSVETLGTAKPVQKLPKIAKWKGQIPTGCEAGGRKVRLVRRDSAAARVWTLRRRSPAHKAQCKAHGIDCINVPDGLRA